MRSISGSVKRRINQLIKAAAKRAKVNPEASAHWFRHAHASHAIDNGAPITLVSQTLGHADLEYDERLCPCAAERELEPVFEIAITNAGLYVPVDAISDVDISKEG